MKVAALVHSHSPATFSAPPVAERRSSLNWVGGVLRCGKRHSAGLAVWDLVSGIEPMDWEAACAEEPMDWESVDCQEPMDWEEVPLPPQVSLPGTSFSTPPVVRPAATPRPTSARRVKKAMRSA
ncbi:hypothetical protein HNY73_017475 [Argiope bruennichi]|uniref:Uncharacterized protein n=1 Tax=Argiope bruennichi TaxID=94029 RepID=A0A8T0EAT4_ARGBR|nr:hypothetical protein HNY73_017475 [Argiope bruennichi]